MALTGMVCVVTGASRGLGRGIALQLGEHGATVYITGRTLKATAGQKGSLEDTAREVEARGGVCIPVQCDHANDDEVKQMFEKVNKDQDGRLDVLVNNAFSGFSAVSNNMGKKFWEVPFEVWDAINEVGLRNHYLCAVLAARLMVPRKSGLIVNVSSPGGLRYTFNPAYGVGKEGLDRMAVDCGIELRKHRVTCLGLWTGVVQTENMIEAVSAGGDAAQSDNKRSKDLFRDYTMRGESVEYIGKCVVHLAKDPNVIRKTAKVHISMDLGSEYGFLDVDGKRPLHIRQLNTLLSLIPGMDWLAKWVPDFIKFPRWMLCLGGNKF